ncbi:cora-domain-containing protein [Mollisia scopiformis]|uniref:Magnesium transporter n=1 Tax=Mollisia scopiformis TaxID=149040 RepID=A0A194XUZ1_MOLSC|nr:cora-domain-containing protein [Mollisia scopiformis]KUJ23527.1 cora-domain-containing protein [Mollisia scopiformis]
MSSKGWNPLQPDDLPRNFGGDDGNDTSMFSLGRHISAKAAAQPKLRCTELDENGNVVLASGEFKKSELIAKYGLLPRDLRKIDSSLLPHILVRPSAILINLLHLRVLIKSNRVLVFDAYGTTDSYNQSAFIYDLEDKLRQKQNSPSAGGLPYEFRALESVLISVITSLETEFEGVRKPVVRVLRELEEDIDRDKLRMLLIYSKKLGTFEQKAKLVRDAIDELLEADDDLAAMYLTEKSHDLLRGEDDHTEVEMLLESYHKLCDEIVQESGNLVSNIRNTEEIVKAILDANRNSLMVLDLKFSIGTLGMGSGAFIAALYGMNLKNFMEESDLGFLGVAGWSFVLSAFVCTYGLTKLRKVQRVSMWGEGGRRGRNWRDEDLDRAIVHREIEAGRAETRERHRKMKEQRLAAMEEMKAQMIRQRQEAAMQARLQASHQARKHV